MILKNCKVKWAKLIKPDEMSGKWSINLYMTAEQLEEVQANGIEPKTDKEGVPFIYAARKPKSAKGAEISPPRVVDANRQPFKGMIGNGSVCNVIVSFYDWTFNKQTGKGVWLEAVQVIDLKEHAGGEDFDVPVGAEINEDGLPF